jgi:general secretion pathway protein I
MAEQRAKGFSLLEVMAAIVLLAICFGVLMRVSGASLNLTSHAMSYSQASLWASSLLDRTFVTDFPVLGTSSGHFDARYRWQMRVTSLQDDGQAEAVAMPWKLYRIELDVKWMEGRHDYSEHFSTLRTVSVRPALPPPVPGLPQP